VRLTQRLQAAGLRCEAVWDYLTLCDSLLYLAATLAEEQQLERSLASPILEPSMAAMITTLKRASERRQALNPTGELWLWLILNGYPFVKRELLRLNPGRVPHLYTWRALVKERSPSLYAEIIHDLKRGVKRIAP